MKAFSKKFLKKITRDKSYFIIVLIFLVVPALVIFSLIVRTLSSEPEAVYAKVRLSQGLWWVSSKRPTLWYAQNIKRGEVEKSLLEKPTAEIVSVRYYPYQEQNQTDLTYDVYLTLKLNASFNPKTEKYVFNRASLAVGAPIEFEFPSAQITGTVIELGKAPFNDNYVQKKILLILEDGYSRDNPHLFNSIKVGDKYSDGSEEVFEVTNKRLEKTVVLASNSQGNIFERTTSYRQNILVEATVKVKEKNGRFIWGEEKLLTAGGYLDVATPYFNFKNFVVAKVE